MIIQFSHLKALVVPLPRLPLLPEQFRRRHLANPRRVLVGLLLTYQGDLLRRLRLLLQLPLKMMSMTRSGIATRSMVWLHLQCHLSLRDGHSRLFLSPGQRPMNRMSYMMHLQ
jgi:hypothetical protein